MYKLVKNCNLKEEYTCLLLKSRNKRFISILKGLVIENRQVEVKYLSIYKLFKNLKTEVSYEEFFKDLGVVIGEKEVWWPCFIDKKNLGIIGSITLRIDIIEARILENICVASYSCVDGRSKSLGKLILGLASREMCLFRDKLPFNLTESNLFRKIRSEGNWVYSERKYRKSLCVLVQTNDEFMLEGYLHDVRDLKYCRVVGNLSWLVEFFEELEIEVDLTNLTFKQLYDILGIKATYNGGVLTELWWPVWVDKDFDIPKSFNFDVGRYEEDTQQPLMCRSYANCRRSGYRTRILSRQICLAKEGVSEEEVKGIDVDHRYRATTYNTSESLRFLTKDKNLGRMNVRINSSTGYRGIKICKSGPYLNINSSYRKRTPPCTFPCDLDRAVKLYDWYQVYGKNIPNYFWQLERLEKEDIYSLLKDLDSKYYYRYLKLLWNTSEEGKKLCLEIQNVLCKDYLCNRGGFYGHGAKYQLTLVYQKATSKFKYLYFNNIEDMITVNSYFEYIVYGKRYKEPFRDRYTSLEDFIEVLYRTENIGRMVEILEVADVGNIETVKDNILERLK